MPPTSDYLFTCRLFFSSTLSSRCKYNKSYRKPGKVGKVFCRVVTEYEDGGRCFVKPEKIYGEHKIFWILVIILISRIHAFTLQKNLVQLAPRFAGGIHQDSQIFLTYILDGLHEDLKRTTDQLTKELEDECDEFEKSVDIEVVYS